MRTTVQITHSVTGTLTVTNRLLPFEPYNQMAQINKSYTASHACKNYINIEKEKRRLNFNFLLIYFILPKTYFPTPLPCLLERGSLLSCPLTGPKSSSSSLSLLLLLPLLTSPPPSPPPPRCSSVTCCILSIWTPGEYVIGLVVFWLRGGTYKVEQPGQCLEDDILSPSQPPPF